MDVNIPLKMDRYWSIATSKIFKNRGSMSMGFHGSHVTHQSGEDVLFLQRAKIPCNVAFFEVQSGPRFQQFLTSSPSHRPQILLENSVTGPNSSVETLHIFTPSTLFCGGFIIHAVPKVYRCGCWPRFFGARKIGTSGRRGASLNCWPPRIPSGKSPCY